MQNVKWTSYLTNFINKTNIYKKSNEIMNKIINNKLKRILESLLQNNPNQHSHTSYFFPWYFNL